MAREVPQYDIYKQPIDGTAASEVISTLSDKMPMSISPDGRQLVYVQTGRGDQLKLATIGRDTGVRVDAQPTNQRTADFSPDGRWLAYSEMNVDALSDVFVRRLDGSGGRSQISAGGGDQPRFTKGGREIVYRRGDAVFAAPFNPESGDAGRPELLFRIRDAGRTAYNRTVGYDVTPDGERFLLIEPIERPGVIPNTVVTGWLEELRRKVPR